jgi:Transcription initiation factor TFIID subunit A
LQATLAPNVVSALEAVARDFLGKTLELGCASARRRRSDVLAPSDLSVGLERMWCAQVHFAEAFWPFWPSLHKCA